MISHLAQLGIFRWVDFLEIALLTGIIYRFCLWLKRDRTSFLLGYFYVGCFIFLAAALLNLQAVLEFYRYSWPALLMLFIIMHQKRGTDYYWRQKAIQTKGSLLFANNLDQHQANYARLARRNVWPSSAYYFFQD